MAKKKAEPPTAAADQTELRDKLAHKLIDDTREVCWALAKEPLKGSLASLVKASVSMRANLTAAYDCIVADGGPRDDTQKDDPRATFDKATRILIATFMQMRRDRAGDLDWTEARQSIKGYQEAVNLLRRFLFRSAGNQPDTAVDENWNLFLASLDDSKASAKPSPSHDIPADQAKAMELLAEGKTPGDVSRILKTDCRHLLKNPNKSSYPSPSTIRKWRKDIGRRGL